jgi:DNA-directed RNA polymerase subunit M/transcription elongation factor TFIIS
MATMSAGAYAQRVRAVRAFQEEGMSPSDALDLEHACWLSADTSGAPYRRSAGKALHALLAFPPFRVTVEKEGALRALSSLQYPSREEDDADSVRIETQREKGKAFLAEISRNDDLSLGEGGVVCAKCKSTEIIYSSRQVRSADEGSTVFAKCQRCDKRWRL